ncbi:MAG: EAL domain-containing protein [Rhizobiaceae bacterium]|nr:EAL domain-containing protein [Rhizobiaceae bacterium]
MIKSAYWGGVLLIAAMATASFFLVQTMLGQHQHDDSLMFQVSHQKALSQRVVFLGNEARRAELPAKTSLTEALAAAVQSFEDGHDRLLELIGPSLGRNPALETVFHRAPHYLDFFATELGANGQRMVAALRTEIDPRGSPRYLAGLEPARLDENVARETLQAYSALEAQIAAGSRSHLTELLAAHKYLYLAIVAVIALVVLFIFRPVSNVIARRTTELVDARNSMAYIAVHDGLTGLHNRTFLRDHFDTLIKAAFRRRERLAVVQIDLDRFKQVNDTLGHAAGDLVLVRTAERMKAACRASDLCVRLGGDEFVMLLNGAGTTDDIHNLALRILERINEPIDFGGATIHPGASAGIAVYPVDADNAADLLVHADLALYSTKKAGGGACSFFSDELRAELDHRKRLEQDLKEAIQQQAFAPHYQPQISLKDGRVTGVEALVRWRHPERGPVSPGEFIPVAEKAGLMSAIGRIVIAKAIAEAAEWHRNGTVFGRLAINVSGAELREPDFTDFLFGTMQAVDLPPHRLSLEIVESVILDDEKTGIAAKLRAIRAAGVHLELDDFGTGYASLSHINPNEIDRLKIDRRFVQNIDLDNDNTKIVRAITELARGLGISIIAEGAETEAELEALLKLGCDQVQGYSIAFPMPEREAFDWLSARGVAADLSARRRADAVA